MIGLSTYEFCSKVYREYWPPPRWAVMCLIVLAIYFYILALEILDKFSIIQL